MTCTCPKCKTICEFADESAGFAITCKNCGRVFVTPSVQEKQLEPKPETPLPGFYHAVFVDTWKIFARPHNYVLIGLVITIAVFKFLLAGSLCADRMRTNILSHMYIAGMALKILLWGWFCGVYFNIIHDTAYGYDDLTDEVEDAFTAIATAFASSIGRPILLFYYALMGSLLPWILFMTILALAAQFAGSLSIFLHILIAAVFAGSVFLFPSALLTIAVTEDILSMRPDYFLRPVVRAFCPYLLVFTFTTAAAVSWFFIGDMDAVVFASKPRVALELFLSVGFQLFAIITMRTIGLYYRHYQCYFVC
jgi:hypothetical protein